MSSPYQPLFRNGVLLCPRLRRGDGALLVLLPTLGNIGGQRIVRVGRTEECLNGQQDCPDLERGRPVVC